MRLRGTYTYCSIALSSNFQWYPCSPGHLHLRFIAPSSNFQLFVHAPTAYVPVLLRGLLGRYFVFSAIVPYLGTCGQYGYIHQCPQTMYSGPFTVGKTCRCVHQINQPIKCDPSSVVHTSVAYSQIILYTLVCCLNRELRNNSNCFVNMFQWESSPRPRNNLCPNVRARENMFIF